MGDTLDEFVRHQHGAVTRTQALAAGLTEGAVRARLRHGRWRPAFRGVYFTFTGPPPRSAVLWAAVLAAGKEAVLSHETAAELYGLLDRPSSTIHVTVPEGRTVRPLSGVQIHRCKRIWDIRHPVVDPPRTRVDETVIDLTQTARGLTDAYGWIARTVNQRLTTPARLREAIDKRTRVRWRRLLLDGLGYVAVGAMSVLEIGYLRDVERAHDLPAAARQLRVDHAGARNYLDAVYREYATRVELDGRAAHPFEERFRDHRRDNAGIVAGSAPLRYGTADVIVRPCELAQEVAALLRQRGWDGRTRRCRRANCVMA